MLARVRCVLGRDDDRAAPVAAHGGQGVVRTGQRQRVRDRVLRVQVPVELDERVDLVGRHPVRQFELNGGPRRETASSLSMTTPVDADNSSQTRLIPGLVSTRVMSRSNPTTSESGTT